MISPERNDRIHRHRRRAAGVSAGLIVFEEGRVDMVGFVVKVLP